MWTTVGGAARFRFECGWEDVIAMHGSRVDSEDVNLYRIRSHKQKIP